MPATKYNALRRFWPESWSSCTPTRALIFGRMAGTRNEDAGDGTREGMRWRDMTQGEVMCVSPERYDYFFQEALCSASQERTGRGAVQYLKAAHYAGQLPNPVYACGNVEGLT